MSRLLFAFVAALVMLASGHLTFGGDLEVRQDDGGVDVLSEGKLVLRYHVKSGAKPIIWPIIGPDGKEMTRAYPMIKDRPGEKTDHVHQRSLWFTHGDVNGTSFWDEEKGHGDIVHREFVEVKGGPTAVVRTRNDWVAPNGDKVCSDERRIDVKKTDPGLTIDFDVTIKGGEKGTKFGDTKEGAFGIRIPTSMDLNSGKGGHIVNSEGHTDKDAWGKAAKWVDYHGPVDGEKLGIAILNHPKSFRFPTYWHVRDYGLFAANVFGVKDFTGKEENRGDHSLAAGESITFRHRLVFHRGDEKEAKIAEAFEEYAGVP
jgi:hypothetical protein